MDDDNLPTCPVCLEVFNDPRMLTCGHCICYACVCQIPLKQGKIMCPMCKQVYPCLSHESLARNYVLIEALDLMKSLQLQHSQGKKKCSQHAGQELDLVCTTCSSSPSVCAKCLLVGNHKGHSHVPIEEYETINKKIVMMNTRKANLIARLRTISEPYTAVQQLLVTIQSLAELYAGAVTMDIATIRKMCEELEKDNTDPSSLESSIEKGEADVEKIVQEHNKSMRLFRSKITESLSQFEQSVPAPTPPSPSLSPSPSRNPVSLSPSPSSSAPPPLSPSTSVSQSYSSAPPPVQLSAPVSSYYSPSPAHVSPTYAYNPNSNSNPAYNPNSNSNLAYNPNSNSNPAPPVSSYSSYSSTSSTSSSYSVPPPFASAPATNTSQYNLYPNPSSSSFAPSSVSPSHSAHEPLAASLSQLNLQPLPTVDHSEKMYIIGGMNLETYNSAIVHKQASWSEITSLPQKRTSTSAIFDSGALYVIGGNDEEGKVMKSMIKFETGERVWRTMPDLQTARCSLSCVSLHNMLWAIGGHDGTSSLDSVEVFNISQKRWSKALNLPYARNFHASTVCEGVIYTLGGSLLMERHKTAATTDHALTRWTHISPMSTARSGLAAVSLGKSVYALGGYDGRQRLNTVEVYHVDSGRWSNVQPMVLPRVWFGAIASYDGKIYAIGGYDGKTRLRSVECFEPRVGRWELAQEMALPYPVSGFGCTKGV